MEKALVAVQLPVNVLGGLGIFFGNRRLVLRFRAQREEDVAPGDKA